MPSIVCIKCGKAVEVAKLQGDYSTFVCGECAEKVNLPAYESELADLQSKVGRTDSEDKRIEFLKAKIAAIE